MRPTITLLSVLLLFTSCEYFEEKKISDEQKQFLLYDNNSQFNFLKNKKDTIELEIEDIKVSSMSSGEIIKRLTFKRASITDSNIQGIITVGSNNSYSIYFINIRFSDKLNELTPISSDTIINSRQYNNVYFMSNEYNDTIFFSLEEGIIQIKNHRSESTYDLIK